MGLFSRNYINTDHFNDILSDAYESRQKFYILKLQNQKMDFNEEVSAINSFRASVQSKIINNDNSGKIMKQLEDLKENVITYCNENENNDAEVFSRVSSNLEILKTQVYQKKSEDITKNLFLKWLNEWEREVQSRKEASKSL